MDDKEPAKQPLFRYREIGLTEAQWAKIDAEVEATGVNQQAIFREMVAARRVRK